MNITEISKFTNIFDLEIDDLTISTISGNLQRFYISNGIRFVSGSYISSFNGYRLTVEPEFGVNFAKIKKLASDCALACGVVSIDVSADMGKIIFDIVATKDTPVFTFADAFSNDARPRKGAQIGCGLDGVADPVFLDLATAPHLLVAGTTGSGKSVFLQTCFSSLLFSSCVFYMIDTKRVEFGRYTGNALCRVATDADDGIYLLNSACNEMQRRYDIMERVSAANLEQYNAKTGENLPRLVVIVDELADLMLSGNRKELEKTIVRIAQLGRAAGVHLIIATQRPSTDVITGLIKANMPCRVAFALPTSTDSRVILSVGGAEKLRGKGDGLIIKDGANTPQRFQAPFLSPVECDNLAVLLRRDYPRQQPKPEEPKQKKKGFFARFRK